MQSAPSRSRAFTLTELLVVIAVAGILTGLMLPAIQAVRGAARRTACLSSLRQMSLAVFGYEATLKRFPPAYAAKVGVASPVPDQWSVRARILPYCEQSSLHDLVDYRQPYSSQPEVAATRIPMFLCPDETNDVVRVTSSGVPRDYPANYAVNMGTWKIWNPVDGTAGDGAFHVNSRFTTADFQDGLSNTLMAAEVRAYTPYLRNSAQDPGPAVPQTPGFLAGYTAAPGDTLMGPNLMDNTGQTEWADGLCQQSGFTTTFGPGTKVPYIWNGRVYDIDYVSFREGTSATREAYGCITARSYHPGLVAIALMDGSVRMLVQTIDLPVWQALGTRDGGEPAGTVNDDQN
jgi:prepilin-type N-terminal cleavage/methylation domain-containing protein